MLLKYLKFDFYVSINSNNKTALMCPIQDFNDALEEFKQISKEVLGPKYERSRGNIKKFSNLEEFKEFHKNSYYYNAGFHGYKPKTNKKYKKTNIPSKINVNRKENPREWDNQYHWFRLHPDAEKYEPHKRCSNRSRTHLK